MNRHVAGAIGLGLSMSITAGACSTEAPKPEALQPTISVPEAPVEVLNDRLGDVTQFIGPIAVDWESCPPGGNLLSPDIRINAPVFNSLPNEPREDGERKLYHTVEIQNVHEYLDASGEVAAWCGTSIVEDSRDKSVQATEEPSILIIPVMPGCAMPEVGQAIPCDGMPLMYDDGPNKSVPDTLYLDPTPPTTGVMV